MLKHAGVFVGTLALAIAGLLVIGAARFVEPGEVEDPAELGVESSVGAAGTNGSEDVQVDASSVEGDDGGVLGLTLRSIDGEAQKLSDYRGDVVVLVNVASRCGLTPQYSALQELYGARKDEGLVVLGFPANDFAGQEPGSNEEIAAFCETEYGVTFPLFEKISVRGEDRHPLYEKLVGLPEPLGGEIEWNFTKFIVGRDGEVAARFGPRVSPTSEAFVSKVEELLSASAPSDGAGAASGG